MPNQTLLAPAAPEISLIQLLTRYWRLSVVVVCACIGLAALVTAVMPKRYEARMKFLVNNERGDLVITPEKNQIAGRPPEVTETQVNSEIELLRSRDILEAIVRDQKLFASDPAKASANPSKLQIARAIKKLEKNLGVNALRKTDIVEVVYDGSDPDLAVSVLNNLGTRYLNAHLAAHSTPGSYKFFADQVSKYNEQLMQTRIAISAFHRKKGLYSLPEQQTASLQALQMVETRLKQLDAEIVSQKSRLEEADHQLSASPERVTTQVKTVSNQMAIQQLQGTLTELQNKRISLAVQYKPGDRMLKEVEDQIANTTRDLEQMRTHDAEERTTDLDLVRQNVKTDYARGQISLSGLERERAEVDRIRGSYSARLSAMDADYLVLQKLEQYNKEAQDNYELNVHRMDEARLADSLDREKFSNVVMIEKPVSSPIPTSPKLGLNLAVGALLGAFLSLALAFYRETKGGHTAEPQRRSPQETLFPSRAYSAASGD
jgi:uncharacterized protein involved in exopolysaccharide biosynthesis